jgi:hypothetical protein
MLDNWEAEKAKIMQGELGVAEDEVINMGTTSNLGGSTLGKSTRKVSRIITSFTGLSLISGVDSSLWLRLPRVGNPVQEIWFCTKSS